MGRNNSLTKNWNVLSLIFIFYFRKILWCVTCLFFSPCWYFIQNKSCIQFSMFQCLTLVVYWIAFTWKTQNQIHWIIPISGTCSFILSIGIFSLEISYAYLHACSKSVEISFQFCQFFCGYIYQCTFYIQVGRIYYS